MRFSPAPTFPAGGGSSRGDMSLSKPWWCHAGPMVRIHLPPAGVLCEPDFRRRIRSSWLDIRGRGALEMHLSLVTW
jgi:hypothetical protein